MKALNLETFGFDLIPVETRDGSKVFSLNTPFVVLEDEKLDIFVEEVGSSLHFFDEGSLTFSLSGRGFSLSSLEGNSPWTRLKKHLSTYDGIIFDKGMIEYWGDIEDGSSSLTRYLSSLLSVEKWARDQLNIPRNRNNLILETRTYLNTWKPEEKFQTIKTQRAGRSGKLYKFDIVGKKKAIDVLSPQLRSTGPYLRKAIDFTNEKEFSTLGIIDDSQNEEAARYEVNIVGSYVPVMLLSSLKNNAIHASH